MDERLERNEGKNVFTPNLHPFNWIITLRCRVDKGSILHVLAQSLNKADWLVEHHRHCNLGQLL